jgi:uncharacterized protein (DUF1015 family)
MIADAATRAAKDNHTVPEFVPFRGLRYADGGSLDAVTAPPYDVIDPDHRVELAAADPHNSVRLILPDGDDPYEGAAALLEAWVADGTLAVDAAPAFYVYRMTYPDGDGTRSTIGVLGALVLPEHIGDGQVLPHERTLPKAKSDRLDLLRATRANLDPIWGLCPTPGLSAALTDVTRTEPFATARDERGVLHEAWALVEPAEVDAVHDAVAAGPLVLADGHHRFETALNYRAERGGDAGAAAILCFVVELADEQLVVHAIHRLVHGLPADVETRLSETCDLVDAGSNTAAGVDALRRTLRDDGGIGLVLPDRLVRLVPRDDALATARGALPESLSDVSSAHFDALVRPALGDATLAYRNDASTCAAMVAGGSADAAIILQPVSVATIRDAGRAGVRMPEKTTFFWPKPRTGMVFRRLDD